MSCTFHPQTLDALAFCVRCARPFCPSCHVIVGGLPYCGTCKEQLVRDLRSGRAATGLAIASPGKRFVAMIIDGLVLAIPMWILIGVAFGVTASRALFTLDAANPFAFLFAEILLVLGSMVGTFLYEWLMLARYGRTLGKMALHLKVLTPQGHSISSGQAAGRAAIKQLFAFLSCFGLVNYIPAFFTPEATAIHDMVASSRVVDWEGDDA